MKKLVYFVAAMFMFAFVSVSCGTKNAENADSTKVDTTVVDTAVVDSTVANTVVADTVKK